MNRLRFSPSLLTAFIILAGAGLFVVGCDSAPELGSPPVEAPAGVWLDAGAALSPSAGITLDGAQARPADNPLPHDPEALRAFIEEVRDALGAEHVAIAVQKKRNGRYKVKVRKLQMPPWVVAAGDGESLLLRYELRPAEGAAPERVFVAYVPAAPGMSDHLFRVVRRGGDGGGQQKWAPGLQESGRPATPGSAALLQTESCGEIKEEQQICFMGSDDPWCHLTGVETCASDGGDEEWPPPGDDSEDPYVPPGDDGDGGGSGGSDDPGTGGGSSDGCDPSAIQQTEGCEESIDVNDFEPAYLDCIRQRLKQISSTVPFGSLLANSACLTCF